MNLTMINLRKFSLDDTDGTGRLETELDVERTKTVSICTEKDPPGSPNLDNEPNYMCKK